MRSERRSCSALIVARASPSSIAYPESKFSLPSCNASVWSESTTPVISLSAAPMNSSRFPSISDLDSDIRRDTYLSKFPIRTRRSAASIRGSLSLRLSDNRSSADSRVRTEQLSRLIVDRMSIWRWRSVLTVVETRVPKRTAIVGTIIPIIVGVRIAI